MNDNKIRPFRLWFQKTLPMLYDDTLTYNELVYKMLEKLNEIIISQNNLNDDFHELHDYVKNYFNNLDVQNEISIKLDEMATDGTLDKIINEKLFTELNDKINDINTRINETESEIFVDNKYHFIGGTTTNPVGNCSVIQLNNTNIIVDIGEQPDILSLLSCLTLNNINKIDYVIISHYHNDHVGGDDAVGFVKLLNSNIDFSDCKFCLPHNGIVWGNMTGDFSKTIQIENTIKQTITGKGYSIIYPTENQTISIGSDTIKFNNLYPAYFNQYYSDLTDYRGVNIGITNYNNFSMCVSVISSNKKTFYTSDISFAGMRNMANELLNTNILQIPHHGIERLIPDQFMNNCSPDIAIIPGSTYYQQFQIISPISIKSELAGAEIIYTTGNSDTIIKQSFNNYEILPNTTKLMNNPYTPITGGSGIMISLNNPQYTDFNQIITPGEYSFQNNTVVQKLLNAPSLGSGFKLIVFKTTPSNSVRQFAISSTNKNEIIATRFYETDGGWSTWTYITSTNKNYIGPKQMQSGANTEGNVPAGSKSSFDITFDQPMERKPNVVATLNTTYSDVAGTNKITVGVSNITTTGFSLDFYNAGSNSISAKAQWIAMVD